ncbi:hypothetical protein SAMN05444274_106315 [Mariniphaga anaerophila]|uniref:Uncharacterized protein n=1 Tax=Mariniphaga anaerophila TaxID=1484053 RepID=A0A1M5CY34_9BACT|nr:hypothetical protein SAMN05444274_106315 [Mariniphaga anaerophila]
MGTLLIVIFGASFAGLVTSSIVMYKILTSKRGR